MLACRTQRISNVAFDGPRNVSVEWIKASGGMKRDEGDSLAIEASRPLARADRFYIRPRVLCRRGFAPPALINTGTSARACNDGRARDVDIRLGVTAIRYIEQPRDRSPPCACALLTRNAGRILQSSIFDAILADPRRSSPIYVILGYLRFVAREVKAARGSAASAMMTLAYPKLSDVVVVVALLLVHSTERERARERENPVARELFDNSTRDAPAGGRRLVGARAFPFTPPPVSSRPQYGACAISQCAIITGVLRLGLSPTQEGRLFRRARFTSHTQRAVRTHWQGRRMPPG